MPKTHRTSAFVLAAGLTLGAGLPLSATAAASVDRTLDQAATAIAEAKANDWIWRDTEKFFDAAQEAAKKGETQKAMQLATKAREQAELAVKQYHLEQEMDRSL